MTRSARVAAQAKINLLLRVLAREQSGYHSLETIFLRLDLADQIAVRVGANVRGRTLDCSGDAVTPSALGPTESNLAYRAACAYADETGWPPTFAIELIKQIPVGAGLGGGSADAGGVLRALDALAPASLGDRLVELGAQLGADVPFMTIDSPMALGWGRGDRLMPLRVLAKRPVVLVVPFFGVSTKDAYGWLVHDRGTYEPRGSVLEPSQLDTWEGIARVAMNDFEPVVGRRYPAVMAYVEALRGAGALPAMMSGSGSAVFGVFADAAAALSGIVSGAGAVPDSPARGVAVWTAERVERVVLDG
jgi:4-diphosphocytidyl-2-C-methyl-D-erythritol kinase